MNKLYLKKVSTIGLVCVSSCMLLCLVFFLTTTVSAMTYAIQHATSDGQALAPGTIVVLSDGTAVRPARQDEGKYVIGSVASLPRSSLPIGAVGVTSSGIASVLVSDIGGDIVAGDRIAVSPLEGVGMKTQSSGWIIGIAQNSLSAATKAVTQQRIETGDGKSVTASIKAISILMSVTYYNPGSNFLVDSVQGMAEAVAGHQVSVGRTVLALTIFALSVVMLVIMIYTAVRNSLISIGRNPLANSKIAKALTKVLVTAAVVIIVTLVCVYLILK